MLQYNSEFKNYPTPFYFYDLDLLRRTLTLAKSESEKYGYHIHYAMKANTNVRILQEMIKYGMGADCVSIGEVNAAIHAGFEPNTIVFAGVGKTDAEIIGGLEHDIFCFNVESIPEVEVINELAKKLNKTANIAVRINPNIDAHTHKYITTGLNENKFGVYMHDMDKFIDRLKELKNISLQGIHFHIGSQIVDSHVFKSLCLRINEIQEWFSRHHIILPHINVGGGFGINYNEPDTEAIPDFVNYFKIFHQHLQLQPSQTLHFELGRSLVCNCGNLISKVLYIKEGMKTKFAILDAGMTELIRPALYQAYHQIENLSSKETPEHYDVVGPICESSDCFGKNVSLNRTQRGDLIAIRSTGAYGEVMSSNYNLRERAPSFYSDAD